MTRQDGQRVLIAASVAWLLLLPLAALAQTVPQKTASWNANTEPDLNGYRLYMAAGACASPGNFITVATFPKTATSGLVPNPTADGTYCFRLTAFDTANNESPFSTAVQRDFNVVPPVAPGAFTITP